MSRVQKSRSVEDMARATIITPARRRLRTLRPSLRPHPRPRPPRTSPRGVFRFRTIEEAQAARARVTAENASRTASTKMGE